MLQAGSPSGTISYLYGMGDSPLAGEAGGVWRYLSGRDALNSVRQETDAAGAVLAVRRYYSPRSEAEWDDPYGVPLVGDGGQPYGYSGEWWDAETELVYLRARYLRPELGVFLTRDSWPGDVRQPGTLNGYGYGLGNPLRFSDPTGHFTEEAIRNYLQQTYKDSWGVVWGVWQRDASWLSMLGAAQAGDIFAGMRDDGSVVPDWFRFEGSGETELTGAVRLGDPVGKQAGDRILLHHYPQGFLGTPVSGLLRPRGEGFAVQATQPFVQNGRYYLELGWREVGREESAVLKYGRIAVTALIVDSAIGPYLAIAPRLGVGDFAASLGEYCVDNAWVDVGYEPGDQEFSITLHLVNYPGYRPDGAAARAYTLWYRPASFSH